MAEFQVDSNRFTTGNGTFNPEYLNNPTITLDPLPHDRGYFEAHLEFAKNYFQTVSNGQLTLTFEILPEIVTLPNEMAAYSPIGLDGSENYKLADLSRDTWEQVRTQGLLSGRQLEPENTMFIIFHAGAGRDLELTGTSLTKTPQDIPSVYLSRESFQRLLDDPNFQGFNTGANIPILNTAILPETQSRPGVDILGNPFVLELSINGLLTATIGSFLGLPDLFNTDSGKSGIGRFGLMDGAGFFSYFGLFPPEPSAWEKVYLGWIDPITLIPEQHSESTIQLPAVSLRQPNSVFKIPITNDEYFLIENRHRDTDQTGVTLTVRQPNGTLTQVTIPNSETRFNPFNFSNIAEILPAGVVTNVSNFDWSLPGGLDPGADRTVNTSDDRVLNGGILIWHIDETVIRSKIADNTINNDPKRPGIRLMEADGAQDIGQPSAGVAGYDQGNAFDFWWAGNDFTVITSTGQRLILYQNRFGDDTTPNNRSHSGSKTFFELVDFSDTSPVATVSIRRTESDQVRKLPDIHLPSATYVQPRRNQSAYPLSLHIYKEVTRNDTLIIVPTPNSISIHSSVGSNLITELNTNLPTLNWSQPLITANGLLVAAPIIPYGSPVPQQTQSLVLNLSNIQSDSHQGTNSLPGVYTRGVPSAIKQLIRFDRSPFYTHVSTPDYIQSSFNDVVFGDDGNYVPISIDNGVLRGLTAQIITLPDTEFRSGRLDIAPVQGTNKQPLISYWSATSINTYPHFDPGTTGYPVLTPGNFSWPVLTDLDNNGSTDYLFVNYSNNTIEAVNLYGAQLNQFPISAPSGITFSGAPLLLSANDDVPGSIIVLADDGRSTNVLIYHLDDLRSPAQILLIGSTPQSVDDMLIHPVVRNGVLYALASNGQLHRWDLKWRPDRPDAYIYGNPATNKQSNVPEITSTQRTGNLIVESETYNWPNPVESDTRIRVLTTEPADISITIINYSGQPLQEIRGTSPGTIPVEFEVNTTPLSSGVYFARITASSTHAKAHKVIKMVVIR